MIKMILVTGSTDGIGLLSAQKLASDGHTVLLHGRSQAKLDAAAEQIGGNPTGYLGDLSRPHDVGAMASAVRSDHSQIDVLINNAGVLKAPVTRYKRWF